MVDVLDSGLFLGAQTEPDKERVVSRSFTQEGMLTAVEAGEGREESCNCTDLFTPHGKSSSHFEAETDRDDGA